MTTIEIPEIHPSINVWTRWHYRKRDAEVKRWNEMIGWLCQGKKIIQGQVDIRIDWYFPTKTKHDYDNYTPKFILDGLVHAGIIEDDHSEIIRKLDDHNFHYDKGNTHTIVTITPHEETH